MRTPFETVETGPLGPVLGARRALNRLTLYRGLLSDPVVRRYRVLLRRLTEAAPAAVQRWDGVSAGLRAQALSAYCRLAAQLAQAWVEAEGWGPATDGAAAPQPPTEEAAAGLAAGAKPAPAVDAWQGYLLQRLLLDENPFTLAAEKGAVPPWLLELAAHDLRALQRAFLVDGPVLRAALAGPGSDRAPEAAVGLPAWGPAPWPGSPASGQGAGSAVSPELASLADIAARLAGAPDWGACAAELAAWHRRHGAGPLARFRAFRWRDGRLVPVPEPDPITLDQLIGYADQKAAVVRNTRRFVQGLPASHVLLYGDRGTGKSATVKAVANAFAGEGLRLVELPRAQLAQLEQVLGALRGRGLRFLLFIDDLSFEDDDSTFKELKALLEGSVGARPENVVLYVTSNRRHLVRERFSDRHEGPPGTADDDVHRQDTLQEKLSLADRFGLTVIYPAPDQEAYLAIVEGLAAQRGIALPGAELRRLALAWALWHNGRSGRSARQFIDDLVGEGASPAGGRQPAKAATGDEAWTG